jgi:deoxyadenosine/deoxycytidine kinase
MTCAEVIIMTIIAIEGLIGAGKTSVLQELRKRGFTVIPERVAEWTYMDKFYKNPSKYALPFQIQILLSFLKYDLSDELIIVERSPQVSRSVFAKMLSADGILTDDDMTTYMELYDHLQPWKPDVYIYLDCPLDVCQARLQSRGDSHAIPFEYLIELKRYYDIFFNYTECMSVNSNRPVCDIVSEIMNIINVSSK